MTENVYYIKYLKYKMKYLKEKEMQIGGGETDKSIFFFSKSKDYPQLSNFFPCSFTDPHEIKDGKLIEFNCNEQYFMYHKAKMFDTTVMDTILEEKDPRIIQTLGGKDSIKMTPENIKTWNIERLNIMSRGLALKFSQNEVLKQKLLATGGKKLYEANPFDDYWGIKMNEQTAMAVEKEDEQVNFPGNMLGILLMKLRDEFKKNRNYTIE
jgi:ribA/ribD-fused uncharacterized protein